MADTAASTQRPTSTEELLDRIGTAEQAGGERTTLGAVLEAFGCAVRRASSTGTPGHGCARSPAVRRVRPSPSPA